MPLMGKTKLVASLFPRCGSERQIERHSDTRKTIAGLNHHNIRISSVQDKKFIQIRVESTGIARWITSVDGHE